LSFVAAPIPSARALNRDRIRNRERFFRFSPTIPKTLDTIAWAEHIPQMQDGG
jgi:hypothetical protein